MTVKPKILLVDDDPDHLSLVERYTSALGLPFRATASAIEAVRHLQEESFDVMVTDMVMPDMDGMELLLHSREHHPGVDVIVMTGFSKKYSYVDVIKAGATDFIAKPFHKDEYEAKLSRLFRERALQADLFQAMKTAEAANKAKTDFLSIISHELRTPMNGVLGFTELLCEMDLPDKAHEFLGLVAESAARLMELINQMLGFSSLDAEAKDLHPTEFELQEFFDTLLPSLEKQALAKKLPLVLALDQSLKQKKVFTDHTVLSQILGHLLSNAIKFSEQGEIRIEVFAHEPHASEGLVLQFNITDHGCGVSREKQEVIFSPFTQAADYLTRRHEGLGLGLAICAKLVQLVNGRIWVESELGQGSTFCFTVRAGLISID